MANPRDRDSSADAGTATGSFRQGADVAHADQLQRAAYAIRLTTTAQNLHAQVYYRHGRKT